MNYRFIIKNEYIVFICLSQGLQSARGHLVSARQSLSILALVYAHTTAVSVIRIKRQLVYRSFSDGDKLSP